MKAFLSFLKSFNQKRKNKEKSPKSLGDNNNKTEEIENQIFLAFHPFEAYGFISTTLPKVDIKERPNYKSATIAEYKNGYFVWILKESNHWYQIHTDNGKGYTLKHNVSNIDYQIFF